MSLNRTLIALAITLSLDASAEEVQAAHDAIDDIFNGDDTSISPQQILNENVQHNGGGVTLDKDGLPWDERIHSSNKKLTGKGVWTARKNVDDSVRNKVVAELRAAVAAGGAPAASAGPAIITDNGPGLGATGPSLGVAGAAVLQAAPSPYEKLVAAITANTFTPANPNGKLTDAFVKSVLDWKKVPGGELQNLAHMGDAVIGEVHTYLAEQLATKGVTQF